MVTSKTLLVLKESSRRTQRYVITMSEMEVPMWLRALIVIIGIIMVVLGLWVIWSIFVPTLLVGLVVMQILGVILLIWGIWQIIKIFMYKDAPGGMKILFLLADSCSLSLVQSPSQSSSSLLVSSLPSGYSFMEF